MLHQSYQAGVIKYITLMGGCSCPAHAPSPIWETELWYGYPQSAPAPIVQKQRYSHSALLERLVRMGADAVLVNAALALALLTRYLWQVSAAPHAAILPILAQRFVDAYVSNAGLVTILNLGVFYVSGLYKHSRSYQGVTKPLLSRGRFLWYIY